MRDGNLTDRQRQVLDRVRDHVRRHGVPPSRAELAQSLGLRFGSAVIGHLEALERKGWVQLNRGQDRGIRLLREGTPVFDPEELPAVAAGTPILADETKVAFRVPEAVASRIHPRADFYLVVRGDSMNLLGYQSGDIVAVRRDPDPQDGDIVVGRIGNEVTLKAFRRVHDTRVELQPRSDNQEHEPIVLKADTEDCEIVGVVVGAMVGAPSVPQGKTTPEDDTRGSAQESAEGQNLAHDTAPPEHSVERQAGQSPN